MEAERVAANIDEAERQMGRGYKGGYKSVQTKERLQATRAYKQKTGYNGQVATRAYHKREATTGGYKSVQTKRVYNKNVVRAVTTKTYVRMGLS